MTDVPRRDSLRALTLYFLRLGSLGFGGPIALVGYMQRDLVERDRLVTEAEYRDGLALAQLAPGPLAAQLAMYLGWVRGGALGATIAGVAFVLPSFVLVVALSAAYVAYGGLPWMQGAFRGIGAAAIAIIARSVVKLSRMTLGRDVMLWTIAVVCAGVTAGTERENLLLLIGCGVAAMLVKRPARVATPYRAAALLTPLAQWSAMAPAVANTTLARLFLYFAESGVVVFGSGLAIVPFLHGGVVQQYHWLSERQFLDAIAISMITPGPVVITVAFIGYLVAGLWGATVAALGVFGPVWLIVLLFAPHFYRIKERRAARDFVAGVTAAATGAIAGAAVVLGRRALVDGRSIILCGVVLALLFTKRAPEPLLIVAAGALSVALV